MQLTVFLKRYVKKTSGNFSKKITQIMIIGMGLLTSCVALGNPICGVVAVGPSAIYDSLGANPADGVGNVEVSCTYVGLGSATPAYQIQLSTGNSNNYDNRAMRLLGKSLIYNLYTNSSHSLVWGNGTGGTSVVTAAYSMTAGTEARNYPVYMRIPGAQLVNAGSYIDSITVTITY